MLLKITLVYLCFVGLGRLSFSQNLPNIGRVILPNLQAIAFSQGLTRKDFLLLEKFKYDLLKDRRSLLGNHVNKTGCGTSLRTLFDDLTYLKPYAVQIFDSWGKLPSGVKTGNIQWLGKYFECQRAKGDSFTGKWCAVTSGNKTKTSFGVSASLLFKLGICIPNTCSENDAELYLQPLKTILNSSLYIDCPIPAVEYTAGQISLLVMCGVLLVLLGCGTLFEMFYQKRNLVQYDRIITDADVIFTSKERKLSAFREFFLSFSVIRNTRLVFDTTQKEGNITSLHGLRFLSMTWVILGHTAIYLIPNLDNPFDFGYYFLTTGTLQTVANATFSVDCFFFLSGLLVTYLGLREASRAESKLNAGRLYLYRYLRLTPIYAFCILLSSTVYTKIGDGPLWQEESDHISSKCQKYWWTNLLYINNIYPSTLGEECFDHGWYLANDTQFFLIAPYMILLLHKNPKIGLSLLGVGTLASIIVTFALSLHYKEQPEPIGIALLCRAVFGKFGVQYPNLSNLEPNKTAVIELSQGLSLADRIGSDLYTKPWCRVGAYFIGIATGFLLHIPRNRLPITKTIAFTMWVIAAALAISILYGLWPNVRDMVALPVHVSALYISFSRPMWSACIAWIVVASHCGYGGPINAFLSWKPFIPLSRLTYGAYLVHPFVMRWSYSGLEVPLHFSISEFVLHFLSFAVLSFGISFLLSLGIEMPVTGMMKVLLKKEKKSGPDESHGRPTNNVS